MDKSETYIKMSDCPEIQRLRGDGLWQNGDCYTCIVSGGRRFTAWWTDTEDEPPQMYHPVWLPRQDQLQEMVDGDDIDKRNRLMSFDYALSNSSNPVDWHIRYSMEQLWLAFVMKEKYNKVWTNNEWRNGSES